MRMAVQGYYLCSQMAAYKDLAPGVYCLFSFKNPQLTSALGIHDILNFSCFPPMTYCTFCEFWSLDFWSCLRKCMLCLTKRPSNPVLCS